jgi:hypothetical protein
LFLEGEFFDQSMDQHIIPNQETDEVSMESGNKVEEVSIPQTEETVTKAEGEPQQKVEQPHETSTVSNEPEHKEGEM